MQRHPLLGLDSDRVDHAPPMLCVGYYEIVELLRCGLHTLATVRLEVLDRFVTRQHGVDTVPNLADQLGRHVGGPEYSEPGADEKSGYAGFGDGWKLGPQLGALRAGRSDDGDLPRFFEWCERGVVVDQHRNIASNQTFERRGAAAIGDMHQLNIGAALEILNAQMAIGSDALR